MWTRILGALGAVLIPTALVAQTHRIIFDTDFILPPGDDGLALLLALQSPEIEILGVTTVAGNESMERATTDALWILEHTGRADIPVYRGADMPWVHEKSEFAERGYGNWFSNEPPVPPPGGFAKKTAEPEGAVEFIVRTVMANPGEVTIVAIGPLTNVATAIRQNAAFAGNVRELVIMGGAVALLPDGAGNMTPNAEFNFWVDPEAARVTLRSGIPILLSPLNVSRKTSLTKAWYEKMIAVETPVTKLLETTMGPRFEQEPNRVFLMYDQVAVGSLIDPSLVTTEELYVDVDANPGISYGTSVGGREIWPGAEGAQKMRVQHDIDWPRFMEMFVQRMQAPSVRATSRPD
jgi:inosine-uridine nucleoside N-ribohydrolase